jgi:hypothetical protein
MTLDDRTAEDGAGAVVEAAEVPGPTFINVLDYDALRTIGNSPLFADLRARAKKRQGEDGGEPSIFTIA